MTVRPGHVDTHAVPATSTAIHTVKYLILTQYTIIDCWFIFSAAGSLSVVTLHRTVLAVLTRCHQRGMWENMNQQSLEYTGKTTPPGYIFDQKEFAVMYDGSIGTL